MEVDSSKHWQFVCFEMLDGDINNFNLIIVLRDDDKVKRMKNVPTFFIQLLQNVLE